MQTLWNKHNVGLIENIGKTVVKEDLKVNHHMNVMMSAAVELNRALDERREKVGHALDEAGHQVDAEHNAFVQSL